MKHGAHLHRPKIKLQRFDGHIEKRIWRVGKRDRELADGVQIGPQIFLFQQAHYSGRAILRRIHQRHRLTEKAPDRLAQERIIVQPSTSVSAPLRPGA